MTITINSRENLTYEEIYEGHANGKSRLPKTLKDIEAGVGANDPQSMTAKANASGVEIKRRRTGGGNSTNVSGIGIGGQPTVARLLSVSRYNALISGYDGSSNDAAYSTPPTRKYIDIDVRGLTKEPFDLIDMVAGVNNSDQVKGSGNGLSARAAKLADVGSRSVVRDFTQIITSDTQEFDVRAFNGDRIGGGGATGEVHGVDQGIQELVDVRSEAIAIGLTGTSFDMSGDDAMTVDIDDRGSADVAFPSEVLSDQRIIELGNADADIDSSKRDAFTKVGSQMAIRSQDLGGEVDITEANTVLGLGIQTVVGATVGSASLGATAQEVIELGSASVDRVTQIRYGTYQFSTLRVFNSINDVAPVAIIVHPDLLDDLIANNP